MVKKIQTEQLMKMVENLYLSSPQDFLLIEIGANDGYCCDRMWDFVLRNDPTSIMIEPIPGYFKKLKENYAHLSNINFENVAISDKEETVQMRYIPEHLISSGKVTFRLESQPHLWAEHWAGGLGSFYENKNNLGCPELKQFEQILEVQTKTFDYILDKYNVRSYKNVVLQTDCEGHDIVIMRSFPFDKIVPKIYISEIYGQTRYPPSHPNFGTSKGLYTKDEESEAIEILRSNGYEIFSENDLVAILKD
tara:strand:- start:9653 stop:10402 length:750 start_codon:yes stop_codon:yes gene_type:complete